MISSSSLQKDIDRAFDLGANSYLVKPVHFEEMQHVFQAIGDYWTSISKWPSPPKVKPKLEPVLRTR
jgi:response regulator of citrate/malate metabolism